MALGLFAQSMNLNVRGVRAALWAAKLVVYLGLFVGVGGAFFAAWIGQGPSGSTVSRSALAIGLISAVASLGLQGLDLLNLPLGGLGYLARGNCIDRFHRLQSASSTSRRQAAHCFFSRRC